MIFCRPSRDGLLLPSFRGGIFLRLVRALRSTIHFVHKEIRFIESKDKWQFTTTDTAPEVWTSFEALYSLMGKQHVGSHLFLEVQSQIHFQNRRNCGLGYSVLSRKIVLARRIGSFYDKSDFFDERWSVDDGRSGILCIFLPRWSTFSSILFGSNNPVKSLIRNVNCRFGEFSGRLTKVG